MPAFAASVGRRDSPVQPLLFDGELLRRDPASAKQRDRAGAGIVDETHPYDEETGLYMAHCTAPGCGTYLYDTEDPPPIDLLCDECAMADE